MGDVVDKKLKLYIRLPSKILEEQQIKDLHPAIIKVYLPRQKSRRWCFVSFAEGQSLEEARDELRSKLINGKKLYVGSFKKSHRLVERKKRVRKSKVAAESMLDLIKLEKE